MTAPSFSILSKRPQALPSGAHVPTGDPQDFSFPTSAMRSSDAKSLPITITLKGNLAQGKVTEDGLSWVKWETSRRNAQGCGSSTRSKGTPELNPLVACKSKTTNLNK